MMAAALMLASCDKDVFDIDNDPAEDQTFVTSLLSPISTMLEQEQNEGFAEYVKLLRYSNMYNALNQSSAGVSFTAFVPDDNALKEFYRRRGVDSLEQLSREYARQFVLYHTLKDSIQHDAFVQKKQVQNLNGDVISVVIDTLHAGAAILNGEGMASTEQVSASNGIVYVLHTAMTPLVETVYDRVGQGASSIMGEALRATGWADKLSVVLDTTINADRQKVVTHYYYTLLNVSDATFAKDGIGSFDQLKAKLKSEDNDGLSEDSLLRKYVTHLELICHQPGVHRDLRQLGCQRGGQICYKRHGSEGEVRAGGIQRAVQEWIHPRTGWLDACMGTRTDNGALGLGRLHRNQELGGCRVLPTRRTHRFRTAIQGGYGSLFRV